MKTKPTLEAFKTAYDKIQCGKIKGNFTKLKYGKFCACPLTALYLSHVQPSIDHSLDIDDQVREWAEEQFNDSQKFNEDWVDSFIAGVDGLQAPATLVVLQEAYQFGQLVSRELNLED